MVRILPHDTENMIPDPHESQGIFDHVRVDFTPVYQCLHIHDMLSLRAQFQQYYSENRKVCSS